MTNPATHRTASPRSPDSDLIGGDWLLNVDASGYRLAYTATLTGGSMAGATASVTRSVMARIAFDQLAIVADLDGEGDRLLFRGDECVLIDPYDGDEQRLGPDADDRYRVPGWCWSPMEASEVDEIVPAAQPDGAPSCHTCGGPCLVFECMTPGCPLGPPLPLPEAPAGHTAMPNTDPTAADSPSERAHKQIANAIMSELWAQLDDLSDDTQGVILDAASATNGGDPDALFAWAEEFRLTLMATIDQRHSDYIADNA